MSLRTVLVGVLALVFGLSAALGIQIALQGQRPADRQETVPVVVAATDVPRFTTMTLDLLKIQEVPKEMLPPDAITKVEDALDRGCITFIGRGETVLNNKLSSKGVRGMAVAIPNGMRATAIKVADVATGVAGFALPGSKVDVVLTVRGSGGNDPSGGGNTTTLLQNVEVLAVDQRVETPVDHKVDASQQRSVTLLVTPAQAAKLQLGQTMGVLHLSLRNPLDDTVTDTAMASMKDFRFPGAKPADVPPPRPEPKKEEPKKMIVPAAVILKPPPPPPSIRTLRGSSSSWTEMR